MFVRVTSEKEIVISCKKHVIWRIPETADSFLIVKKHSNLPFHELDAIGKFITIKCKSEKFYKNVYTTKRNWELQYDIKFKIDRKEHVLTITRTK
ncbi:MAG: hypothetical protein KBG30_12255 [Bacteroidales bacterium]|nr:hypothetical protein [Bacteroidales bacterium]